MNIATLNKTQMVLIESFAGAKTQEEADELAEVIKRYYAAKLEQELENQWNDGTLNQEKIDQYRTEHFRIHA